MRRIIRYFIPRLTHCWPEALFLALCLVLLTGFTALLSLRYAMHDALIFASVALALIFTVAAISYAWGYVIGRCLELMFTVDEGWVKPVVGFVLLVLQLFVAIFLFGMIRAVFG